MKNLILVTLLTLLCLTLSTQSGYAFELGKITSVANKQTIDVSILTEEEALENFKLMATDAEIPFNYPKDGCFARAHLMAHKLEDRGIIVGKSFFVGRILVPTSNGPELWRYHVAPVVLVQKNGALIPTIFDPSLFAQPVSVVEFKRLLSRSPSSRVALEFFNNRFALTPEDKDSTYTEYQPGLESQVQIMLDHIRALNP